MKLFSRISIPATVLTFAMSGILNLGHEPVEARSFDYPIDYSSASQDTVIYPIDSYRWHRSAGTYILDSLEHDEQEDSSQVELPTSIPDSTFALVDSTYALMDSVARRIADSTRIADSIAVEKAKFAEWYASLSRKERRKYDAEQRLPILIARADSISKAKEEAKAIRDSIIEATPRILETFAIPDSMQYKRIISWTLDPDFHTMEISIPDTSFNYHFYDYPFLKNDVNATWLGVAGSPLQYYDFFKRKSEEDVEFYTPMESWSRSTKTILNYNTKTPYTELAYYGTMAAENAKISDNLHLFSTQNFSPELNFTILYERFGGGGMLEREKTVNNNFAVQLNYLGKKYLSHVGYIRNVVSREENGGVQDVKWVRDTAIDAREMPVNLKNAKSKITKNTVYLNQQVRIPFNFINKLKASRDSSFVFNADSLDRNITTAFIGHSSEFSVYTRRYEDQLTSDAEKLFYNNVFNNGSFTSYDSLGVSRFDNKFFIKLQPWSSDAIVSKLNIGIGDRLEQYFDSTSVRPSKHIENSIYAYAGIEGQIRDALSWNAKGNLTLFGAHAGDFIIEANTKLDLYPFRRARKSPLSISAHFETSLTGPNFYQEKIKLNHFSWDNDFSQSSSTIISSNISIPHWKFSLDASYALLANQLYYNSQGISSQSDGVISIFGTSLRKDFVFGPLHLDNRALFQLSSDQSVVPVPTLALNLKYYVQFPVKKDVMEMQIGVNAFWNSPWHSPAFNPNMGVFYNQDKNTYNNGPFLDAFVNIQWKRASIFIKYQNLGNGWPMKNPDYFCADGYIVTQSGMSGLKIGIFWPFYVLPGGNHGGSSTHSTAGTGQSQLRGPSSSGSSTNGRRKASN